MKNYYSKKFKKGFTLLELAAVIFVIGVLVTISILSYRGIVTQANDAKAKADMNKIASALALYSWDNKTAGKTYYSGDGYDSDLKFEASEGVVIDVVTNSSGYCIRGYSTNGTVTDINNAYEKESVVGICDNLGPSAKAGGFMAWKQISSGSSSTCATATINQVYCWGNGANGRIGTNSTDDFWVPTPVYTAGNLNGKTIKYLDSWWRNGCVIASDDLLYCWGDGQYGTLGDNNPTVHETTVPIPVNMTNGVSALYGKTVKFVDVSTYGACAIANDDKPYCWGEAWSGMLGNGTTTKAWAPVAVTTSGVLNGKTIVDIATGDYHNCALDSQGAVYCWGWDRNGMLGDNDSSGTYYSTVPKAINMTSGLSDLYGKTVKEIDAGFQHTCTIANDNLIYCWGDNDYGQIGNNAYGTDILVPKAVNMTNGVSALYGKTIKAISTGSRHTCAIASDDKAYCWGYNTDGQIGNGTISTRVLAPTAVDTSGVLSGKTVKAISAGEYLTCAIASDDQMYCWGNGEEGLLGNNSTISSSVPVAVTQTDL
ncbi:MAG: prepilin-type N-terminal cleavage/methylation domain-containing protein [Candidatus Saccharimonadaceae bacterium]|nr:prepilin-type N-terminal cleavage/methylation domain-containing protein [Candidatus Saccharimonadaceae bacterium]